MPGKPLQTILMLSLLVGALGATPQESKAGNPDCQPGRTESAKRLIKQSKKFQLKASQFNAGATSTINDAGKLKGQAQQIEDNLKKLNGQAQDKNSKQLQKALADFKAHSDQYRIHLDKVEKQLGFCKASAKEYDAHLDEYSLHVDQFHIANIRPPHICPQLMVTEGESRQFSSQMRTDQQRLMSSENDLAQAENELAKQLRRNVTADGKVQQRSALQDEERKLAAEFAGLKEEYEMLKIQQEALAGKAATIVQSSVKAKVKQ